MAPSWLQIPAREEMHCQNGTAGGGMGTKWAIDQIPAFIFRGSPDITGDVL